MINLSEIKFRIKSQEQHKNNDIVERCFNQGIETAIKVIEIYEEAEKIFSHNG